MKDTYDYEQKAQARRELRDFVSRTYPNESQRKNLKVLTLMGHEDNELTEVWDPLGIPRSNISSVEYNKDVYDAVNNKGLGIRLVYGGVDDFIEQTREKFDIINLDYQGYLNSSKKKTLNYIAYKEMLRDKGILATWFSGRREDKDSQFMRDLENRSSVNGVLKSLEDYFTDKSSPIDYTRIDLVTGYVARRAKMLNEGEIRSDFISDQILFSFQYPVLNFNHHPLITSFGIEDAYFKYIDNTESFKNRNNAYLEAILNKKSPPTSGYLFSKESFEAFKNIREKILRKENISFEDKTMLYKDFTIEGCLFLESLIQKKVKGFFSNKPCLPNEPFIGITSAIIMNSYTNAYSNNDMKRFSYHSDNGTPMFVDINLFEKIDFSKFLSWKFDENKRISIPLSIIKDKSSINNTMKGFDKYSKLYLSNFLWEKEPRKELEIIVGAESQITCPEISRADELSAGQSAILSNDEIYLLLSQGKSTTDILSIDSSLTPAKISARKAWITMRNNKSGMTESIDNKLIVDKSIDNTEKTKPILSKDDVLMLLKEFSPEEIINAFPNMYSMGQLRAYKAHMTMGTYKKTA